MYVKLKRQTGLIEFRAAPISIVREHQSTSRIDVHFLLASEALKNGSAVRASLFESFVDDEPAVRANPADSSTTSVFVNRVKNEVSTARAKQQQQAELLIARSITSVSSHTSRPTDLRKQTARATRRHSGQVIKLSEAYVTGRIPWDFLTSEESRFVIDELQRLFERRGQPQSVAPTRDDRGLFCKQSIQVGSQIPEKLFIELELLDSTGIALETLRLVNEPAARRQNTLAVPSVRLVVLNDGRHKLTIMNHDSAVQKHLIYRRIIAGSEQERVNQFSEVASVDSQPGHEAAVELPHVGRVPAVYRVVSIAHDGSSSSDFVDVVSPHSVSVVEQPVGSIVVEVDDGGFSIDVVVRDERNAVVKLYRRDLTLLERKKNLVGTGKLVRGVYSVKDPAPKTEHVYEYSCELSLGARTHRLNPVVTTYLPKMQDRIFTEVKNLRVSRAVDELEVVFDVGTSVPENDLDAVFSELARRALGDLFTDDVLRERDKLRGLIVHGVHRTNLDDGTKEDLGIVLENAFRDTVQSKKMGASALRPGSSYRYEVFPMLRETESLFTSVARVLTDASTGKTHQFMPAKHRHPLTLRRGTIVTNGTLEARHSQSAFEHGRLGMGVHVDVRIEQQIARVVEQTVARVDAETNEIKWKISGSSSTLDCFVVLRSDTQSAEQTYVGKCLAQSKNGSYTVLDKHGLPQFTSCTYMIVPVSSRLSVEQGVDTNAVEI